MLLEVREEKDIELHAAEVRKRAIHIKVGDNEQKLSDNGPRKIEKIEGLKNVEINGFEDMVFRLELSFTGNLNLLDMKYIDASTIRYTLE